MIYLIITEDKQYVKIGFTKDPINKRLYSIQAGCPIKLLVLETFQGTMQEEKYLHFVCRNYHIRREWFRYSEDLLKLVHKSVEDMRKIETTTTKDIIYNVSSEQHRKILIELLKEARINKYSADWILNNFYTKSEYVFKEDVEFIAINCSQPYSWYLDNLKYTKYPKINVLQHIDN